MAAFGACLKRNRLGFSYSFRLGDVGREHACILTAGLRPENRP